MSAPKSSVKCVRDFRDLPLEAYRLPSDGRKWKQLAIRRQRVADRLATYANGDGTSITAGVTKVAKGLGMSRRTVFYVFHDLGPDGLGMLVNEGQIQRPGQKPGTCRRRLVLPPRQGVQDSPVEGCQIEREGVQDSPEGVQDSPGRGAALGCTQPSFTDHKNRPLPPGGGGGADANTSDEGKSDHPPSTTSLPNNDGPSGGSEPGRDVVTRLKRDFHATHGTYPRDPSKGRAKQLTALAITHGEEFWRAWKIFLSEGPCRPDTHSPWGWFISDFNHWLDRAIIRKPNTQDLTPPWVTSSKGAIQ